jgi:hypothetical protein
MSADFRRHVAAPPAVPARNAPYDMWHAAIQDVPVGPMTRDELARKIESGAVTTDSLCWREGMDDWRPLGELAELQGLMRRQAPPRASVRPPRAPPAVPGPVGARASFFPEAALEEIDDEGSEPTRIADMTGPQLAATGATSHPRIPAVPAPPSPASASASIPSPAMVTHTAVSAPEPERTRRKPGMSGSTGMAFGVALTLALLGGPLLWDRLKSDPTPTPTPVAAAAPAATAAPKLAEADIQPDVGAPDEATPSDAIKQPARTKPVAGTGVKPKTDSKGDTKLSAAEQALLDRMGGGGGPDLENKASSSGAGAAPSGPALTAAQLMKVVQDNKPALQRCYETALRSVGGKQEDTLKIKVGVTVGTSGTVKGVRTQGQGLGNMNDCLSKSVKRWRFPTSGGDSEFEFPLVFQPGA